MLHVMFSSSAAGTLRGLLSDRGVRQKVVDLGEHLDWGPIAIVNLDERQAWLDQHAPLGFPKRTGMAASADLAKWDWLASSEARFRKLVLADPDRLVWIAPRSAAEQAGLHWYLDRFGGAGTNMIIADYAPKGAWDGEVPPRLGALNQDQTAEFLDECPRVPWDNSLFPTCRWQQLVEEDTLLRIVRDGALHSAPEDFFDGHILANCPDHWIKSRRVEGDAMVAIWDAGHDVDSLFIIWRLRDLIGRGAIACEGELPIFGAGSERDARIRRVS